MISEYIVLPPFPWPRSIIMQLFGLKFKQNMMNLYHYHNAISIKEKTMQPAKESCLLRELMEGEQIILQLKENKNCLSGVHRVMHQPNH